MTFSILHIDPFTYKPRNNTEKQKECVSAINKIS